jgi:hypothetical protein
MINSFLLIGQSNMAGRGRLSEVEPIENSQIFMFREGNWVTAQEPIHTDKPDLAGIGLGMSFADELNRKSSKQIGLIPCAFGGTSLEEWHKGGDLYLNAVNSTKEALRNSTLKGILWHQGESDSDRIDTAESYKDRFMSFINSLMEDIGALNIPIVLGELGEFLAEFSECSYYQIVNEQLADIARENKNFTFVSARDLTDNGDFLHFNAKSLREFGMRYEGAWEACSGRLGVNLE